MAASTNATRSFGAPPGPLRTPAGPRVRAARQAEQTDVIPPRVLSSTAQDDRPRGAGLLPNSSPARLPALGEHPPDQNTIFPRRSTAEGGLFPPARVAMIHGHALPAGRPATCPAVCHDPRRGRRRRSRDRRPGDRRSRGAGQPQRRQQRPARFEVRPGQRRRPPTTTSD
jgi:hypothetical protein